MRGNRCELECAGQAQNPKEMRMSGEPIPYYPVLLDLRGRRCLVVGGGPKAENQVSGLLGSGATVTVVAETLTETLDDMAQLDSFHWVKRPFEANDLEGMFLVVSTGETEDDKRVLEEARKRGIPCSCADGDMAIPVGIQRGHLTVAVSTAGTSPALEHRIQRELAAGFGAEYAQFLEILDRLSREIHDTIQEGSLLERLDAELVDSPMLAFLRNGNREAAERIARTILQAAKEISAAQQNRKTSQ